MFRIGEHVMYRNIGICEVEAIGKIGFSLDKEKDYYTSVDILTSEISWEEMAVTTIPNERGISFEKLQKIFENDTDRPVTGYADYRSALFEMKKKKREGQKLFCTGSLYFIGALLEMYRQSTP